MLFLKSNGLKLFSRLIANYRHRQQRANDIKDLYRMNDRLLADIGISRYQIVEVVDGLIEKSVEKNPLTEHHEKQSDDHWQVEAIVCCPQT